MTVSSDRPMYIHADGEIYTSFGSNLRKVTVEVLPSVLKVIRG
jgi:diacylglycerol kinase family enzyme